MGHLVHKKFSFNGIGLNVAHSFENILTHGADSDPTFITNQLISTALHTVFCIIEQNKEDIDQFNKEEKIKEEGHEKTDEQCSYV